MLKRYVTLKADGQRLREVGLDRWVAEQQERAAKGFCHRDISIPQDRET